MAEADKPRTLFAPVVLGGLGSAAVLAVVSARDWFALGGNKIQLGVPDSELRADMPLALALALVVLAAWGVVLVTGRRARRWVLAVAVLAASGIVACVVAAPLTLPDQIREGLATDGGMTARPTTAYVIACVVVLVAVALAALGWRLAPRWPEMSSRYDASTARTATDAPAEELADLELWKALDEGRDPTER